MQLNLRTMRTGSTFIELLLFIVIISMVGVVVVNLLFQATEARILQETQAQVEQNGAQILQEISEAVHNGSRILTPSVAGQTGALLTIAKTGYEFPVEFSLSGGYIVKSEAGTNNYISTDQVSVVDFQVISTEVGEGEQSVLVRFTVSKIIRLSNTRSYSRVFEATFSLYTDTAFMPPRHNRVQTAMLYAAPPLRGFRLVQRSHSSNDS